MNTQAGPGWLPRYQKFHVYNMCWIALQSLLILSLVLEYFQGAEVLQAMIECTNT